MALVTELVHDGASGEMLSGWRLKALDALDTIYGAGSEMMRKIIEREKGGYDISNILHFFSSAGE